MPTATPTHFCCSNSILPQVPAGASAAWPWPPQARLIIPQNPFLPQLAPQSGLSTGESIINPLQAPIPCDLSRDPSSGCPWGCLPPQGLGLRVDEATSGPPHSATHPDDSPQGANALGTPTGPWGSKFHIPLRQDQLPALECWLFMQHPAVGTET